MSLKIERVKKNLTQKELSNISNVSVTTISRIEKWGVMNADVRFKNLTKLAKSLSITVEELIKEET